MFKRIVMIDEGYCLYWEETDFCWRAAQEGFSCWYVPASRIIHIGGASTGVRTQLERLPHYWFQSRARFFRRRHGRVRSHLINLVWLSVHQLGWLLARLAALGTNGRPILVGLPSAYLWTGISTRAFVARERRSAGRRLEKLGKLASAVAVALE